MNKRYWLPTLLAACLLGGTGCSDVVTSEQKQSMTDGEKTVTLLYTFPTASLEPSGGSIPLRAGITETLVRLDGELKLQPWLATSWEATDERTWVFTLRDGVTFHDGTKLDGPAAIASLERSLKLSKSLAAALKIDSMEADGQRLTLRTKEPYPVLPSELVNPNAGLISAAAAEKMGAEAFAQAPVGTGPFRVEAFTPDVEVKLTRFDAYWEGAAKVEHAVFKFNTDANVRALALQSREADIVYQLPVESLEAIKAQKDLRIESVPSLRTHFLYFNMEKPALQNLKVRQALDKLVDRDSIVQGIMQGHALPAGSPFMPKFSYASTFQPTPYDEEGAKRLLKEAGYGPDKRLSLELVTYKGRPELPQIAELYQSSLANAGVDLKIRTVENVDNYLKEDRTWDVAVYSNLTAPRGDAGYYLNTAYTPEGALNAGRYRHGALLDLIGTLNRTGEPQVREGVTMQAVRTLTEDLPQSFLIHPNLIVGVNERVTNWQPGAEEYYMLTNDLDVK